MSKVAIFCVNSLGGFWIALGRRRREQQDTFWVAADGLGNGPRNAFCDRLNQLLAEIDFDRKLEEAAEPFYKKTGRRGLPPGVYFRMIFIGYFEDISSQRGIAWRCEDSRSLARFLGYAAGEATPDHSTLSLTRERLPMEVHALAFELILAAAKDQRLLAIYVRGLLSEIGRKNVETIALQQGVAPRTLQRFLQTIKWDHDRVLRRCRQLIAIEHTDSNAIGVIDETGTAKSGSHTVGVKRQYNGNRGKIENAVVNVAASFATSTFQCLIGAQIYLPKEWADDFPRRKKHTFQTTSSFAPRARSLCS